MSTVPASLRALLSGLIDYAGLFPPAALDMKTAVANYARYLAGPDAWALGRFVLPVSRFPEFEAAMAEFQPIEPWGISALMGTNAEADMLAIEQFNDRNKRRAIVDTVEVKASTREEIGHIRAFIRGTINPYFELPVDKAGELVSTVADIGARAKMRTGGVTPAAFPSSKLVAKFLVDCAFLKIPFKATAGLHHPVRCVKPLTYEPNAPSGTMHGFLNLFLAAAFAKYKTGVENLMSLLEESSASTFRFFDDHAECGKFQITKNAILDTRRRFAISFGSCSFEEPLADLRELKLL